LVVADIVVERRLDLHLVTSLDADEALTRGPRSLPFDLTRRIHFDGLSFRHGTTVHEHTRLHIDHFLNAAATPMSHDE
jgi:hypothetical protein